MLEVLTPSRPTRVIFGFLIVAIPFALGGLAGEKVAQAQSSDQAQATSAKDKPATTDLDPEELAKHPVYRAKRKHLMNVAKLDRIEAIARDIGDHDLLARVATLRPLEERRFRRAMARRIARQRALGR